MLALRGSSTVAALVMVAVLIRLSVGILPFLIRFIRWIVMVMGMITIDEPFCMLSFDSCCT